MCKNNKTTEFVGAKHRSDCVGKHLVDVERVLGTCGGELGYAGIWLVLFYYLT